MNSRHRPVDQVMLTHRPRYTHSSTNVLNSSSSYINERIFFFFFLLAYENLAPAKKEGIKNKLTITRQCLCHRRQIFQRHAAIWSHTHTKVALFLFPPSSTLLFFNFVLHLLSLLLFPTSLLLYKSHKRWPKSLLSI